MGWLIGFTGVFVSDNLNVGPTYIGVIFGEDSYKGIIWNDLDFFFMNITTEQPLKFLRTCLLSIYADSMTLAAACPHASRT